MLVVATMGALGACGGSGGRGGAPASVSFSAGPVTPVPVLSVFTPPHTLLEAELGDHDFDGTPDLAWVFATTYVGNPNFHTQSMRGDADGTFSDSYGGNWHQAAANPLLTTGDVLGVGAGGFARAWVAANGLITVVTFGWRIDASGVHGVGGSDNETGALAGLAVGDWDGDQVDDVVIAEATGGRVVAWRSLGEAGLAAPQPTLLPVGQVPTGLAAGQFDGDARDDVVAAVGGNGYVVLTSLGTGLFAAGPAVPLGAGRSFTDFVAGDFNGDGRQDIAGVVAQAGQPNTLGVLLGYRDGTFGALISTALEDDLGGTTLLHVHAGDLNGDGRADLACVAPALDRTIVALSDGVGGFALATDPDLVGGGNATLGLGDVDSDGDLDLLLGNAPALTVRVLLNDPR